MVKVQSIKEKNNTNASKAAKHFLEEVAGILEDYGFKDADAEKILLLEKEVLKDAFSKAKDHS